MAHVAHAVHHRSFQPPARRVPRLGSGTRPAWRGGRACVPHVAPLAAFQRSSAGARRWAVSASSTTGFRGSAVAGTRDGRSHRTPRGPSPLSATTPTTPRQTSSPRGWINFWPLRGSAAPRSCAPSPCTGNATVGLIADRLIVLGHCVLHIQTRERVVEHHLPDFARVVGGRIIYDGKTQLAML